MSKVRNQIKEDEQEDYCSSAGLERAESETDDEAERKEKIGHKKTFFNEFLDVEISAGQETS